MTKQLRAAVLKIPRIALAYSPSFAHIASHFGFGRAVHLDHRRPRPLEAFGLPLARRVDAHLRSVVGQARGVVERIDGTERELNVALGIDVVGHAQHYFSRCSARRSPRRPR